MPFRSTVSVTLLCLLAAACSGGDDDYTPPAPTATRLAFVTQPVGAQEGAALATQPVVEVRDADGDRVAGSTASVTLALGSNPSTGVLGGTTTVNAIDGRATFTGLTVDKAGTGYTLVATATGLTAATSSAFDMTATPAVARTIAVVSGNNQSGPASAALALPIRVRVTATSGGAAQAGVAVTFAATAGGGSVAPATVTTDANGEAQATWTLGAAGAQTATASAPGAATPASFSATVLLAGFQLASVSPSMDGQTGGSANFTCGVTSDGRAFCWGDNTFGMHGNGTTTRSTRPVQVTGSGAGSLVLRSIASGVTHVCALNDQGAAFCWGENGFGKLGRGNVTPGTVTTPNAVVGGFVFSQVDVGESFSCGLIAAGQANAGRIVCWGVVASFNSNGSPQLLPGARVYSRISLGRNYGCGLVAEGQPEAGQAFCWGINPFGALGLGGPIVPDFSTAEPLPVEGARTWSDIAAGDFDHTCGITTAGVTFCWGLNNAGQLGEGAQGTNRTAPVQVQGAPALSRVTTGNQVTCGIVAAGQAGAGQGRCWGFNQQGQAGTGVPTQGNVLTPTAVAGNLVYTSLASGGNNTCGITAAGTFCWGANLGGSIGDGTIGNPGNNSDPNNAKGTPSPVAQP